MEVIADGCSLVYPAADWLDTAGAAAIGLRRCGFLAAIGLDMRIWDRIVEGMNSLGIAELLGLSSPPADDGGRAQREFRGHAQRRTRVGREVVEDVVGGGRRGQHREAEHRDRGGKQLAELGELGRPCHDIDGVAYARRRLPEVELNAYK